MIEERQTTIEDLPEVEIPVEGLFSGEVHPVADLFPMMSDDELDDLAADIKANGLVHPIVLDALGRLIDGRNRLEACRRAGVPPTFKRLEGDAFAFIASANLSRRNMRSGPRAIVLIEMRLKALDANGNKKRAVKPHMRLYQIAGLSRAHGISEDMLNKASVILHYAPELAEAVKTNLMEINEAYGRASQAKEWSESPEGKLSKFEISNPDLAALVRSGDMTLAGAIAEAEERKRIREQAEKQERERIAGLTRRFDNIVTWLEPPGSIDPEEWAEDWLNADAGLIGDRADFSAARVLRAADTLLRYARLKKERENG